MRVSPDLRVECVSELTPEWFHKNKMKAILVDLDGTLRARHDNGYDPHIKKWVCALKDAGITVCIVSNGGEKRIGRAAEQLGISYVADAEKPSAAGLLRAMKELDLQPESTLMVGNSKADILAGHSAGLRTVRVDTIEDTAWEEEQNRKARKKRDHIIVLHDGCMDFMIPTHTMCSCH